MAVKAPDVREAETKRRWRIPPPLLRDGHGPGPEGLAVLGEVPGELGAVLWKSLRSVYLWADTEAVSRRNLFPADAADRRQLEILSAVLDSEPGVREALEDLLPILTKPDRADADFTGIACNRIAAWAHGRGARHTQLEFLQAAAVCCPADATYALLVGKVARDLTHYSRAEAWFYRAVGLARQVSDWKRYVDAYLDHGIMMFRRGALPSARRSFLKALRRSRRQGLRDGEAKALHDLFTLEYRADDVSKAMRYAAEAAAAYDPSHERFPRLAHDVAYAWLERGDFEHSLPVFLETLGRIGTNDRPFVLGSVGRAAAGSGDEPAYEWVVRELRGYGPEAGVAEAWVDMARAALSLGRVDEAREAADLAESIARARREGQIRFLAASVLDQARDELEAETERDALQDRADQRETADADALARDLIRTLQSAPEPTLAGV